MQDPNKVPTLRQALRRIRFEMAGENYITGHASYECDRGTLLVRNADADGGSLLGVFEAELIDHSYRTIKVYRV